MPRSRFLRDFNAGLRPLNAVERAVHFFFRVRLLKTLFTFLQCLLGAAGVNLVRPFGGLGEDRNLVRQDLGKAPRAREELGVRAAAVNDLPDSELGNKWSMPGEYAEITILARYLDL